MLNCVKSDSKNSVTLKTVLNFDSKNGVETVLKCVESFELQNRKIF